MASLDNQIHNLICIQYPGIVNNHEKAIENLGGLTGISTVYSSSNLRLGVRLRSRDVFSKPPNSTSYRTMGLLIKVRVKKKRRDLCGGIVKPQVTATELVGVVKTIYKFETLCDFQYLPLVPKVPGSPQTSGLQCIQDDIVPSGIPPVEWFSQPASLFLVPAMFSRMDSPQSYHFRTTIFKNENTSDAQNRIIIGTARKKRFMHAVFVSFNHTEPVPTEPKKLAVEAAKNLHELIEVVRKLFDVQPIWSRQALLIFSKVAEDQLKYILPVVAYYFVSGPWRIMWVKFGCDPRKEPQCRIYQYIDLRVKNVGGIKDLIKSRSYSYTKKIGHKAISQPLDTSRQPKKKIVLDEKYCVFRPGVLPPKRQIYYQYCNLKVPEIEEMLARLGEVLPGSMCHERRGWLPIGFDEQCREILNQYVTEKIKQLVLDKQQGEDYLREDEIMEDALNDSLCDNTEENQNDFDDADEDEAVVDDDGDENAEEGAFDFEFGDDVDLGDQCEL